MSTQNEDDEEPVTVLLKALLIAARPEPDNESLNSTGKLICTVSKFLELGGAIEFRRTHSEETLGRGEHCTVRTKSADLSREHARVRAFSNQWVIEDCGSRNGVWINDLRVNSRSKISSGDIVRLGRVPFRFEVLDVAPSVLVEAAMPEPRRVTDETTPFDDTIALELSADGELVPMQVDEEAEPESQAASADADQARKDKALLPASSVGVAVKDSNIGTSRAALDIVQAELPNIVQQPRCACSRRGCAGSPSVFGLRITDGCMPTRRFGP